MTSVETGEILGTWVKSKGIKGIADVAMGLYDEEVTIAEVTKEAKGKVKKFMLHNPWGFSGNVTFLVYVIEAENVGGETVNRERQVGECVSWNAQGSTAEFSVKDGESEIYDAMQDDKKIIFRHKEFKFLGQTFK